ncbi:MAG: 2-phospho-L-lactate transferase [Actinomycetota bacterium]|nr:2-phospho-L-lactate transferase [Actinomycetota bacterium]
MTHDVDGGGARTAVLCGGVGAARLLAGLVAVVPAASVTAIVNVGDDTEMHGLHISPDLDTITYTLGGGSDTERGWGLAGETWAAMDQLDFYGGAAWFRLGDRDLGTHLYRTGRLKQGASLSAVTAEITQAWGIGMTLLPVSDDPVRTRLELEGGEEVDFQEYFVRLRHSVAVRAVHFVGAEQAKAAPGVLEALEAAETIVIAPSNPIVSIGPVLAVPGITELLARRRRDVVAVSPLVGGRALKGPADRLLVELGGDASAVGVAEVLTGVAGTLVIDVIDAGLAGSVEQAGMACRVVETVMSSPAASAALAAAVLAARP